MTTVSPSPNWYADPTGRHEARYWDGFTWTAHVADRGTPGIDPLVRRTPVEAAVPETGAAEPVGPGTASLRTMAETRTATPAPASAAVDGPESPTPTPRVRPPRRRSVAYDVCVVLAAILVIVLGGYVLWSRWLHSSTDGGTDPRGAVTWAADGYRLALPPSWVDTDAPVDAPMSVDGTFQVIDGATVVALVGDDPAGREQIPDADALARFMTSDITSTDGQEGITTQVLSTDVTEQGKRLVGQVVADVSYPDGTRLRAVEIVVVAEGGSLGVMLLGDEAGVTRHVADARAAARSVDFR